MTKEQAFQIIKQTIDLAIKSGIVANMEQAGAILQAWTTIIKSQEEKPDQK